MAGAGTEVYVKLPSGRTVTLYAFPADTVLSLTRQVAEKADLSVERLKLKYQGKVLKPSHTVNYLGIRVETILKAEIVEPKTWTINILHNGTNESVRFENTSTVGYVMSCIADVDKVSTTYKLQLGTRLLNKELTLEDAGATDGCQLTLTEEKIESSATQNTTKEEEISQDEREKVMGTFDAAGRPVEVVFSFDTTGSMYSCLDNVRAKLREACNRLLADIADLRIGVIAHGDYCDQGSSYVIRYVDLTRDVDSLVNFVRDVPASGGGDCPECYEWVLHKAQQLEWSEDAAKALVVIGDSLPHGINYTDQRINWHEELDVLCGMGIKVYGIQALNSLSEAFYRQLAEHSGGAYIKFNNFSVITDMFLAVCYREADGEEGGEQLAAFVDQVEAEGRLQGDLQEVLQQVAKPAEEANSNPQRYVAEAWWDPNLDKSIPQYSYDATTDKWSPHTGRGSVIRPSATWTSSTAHGASPSRGSRLSQSMRRIRTKFRSSSTRSSPSSSTGKTACIVM